MSYLDALDIVVARTGHERYRELCSILNPDDEQREAYRAHVIAMATGESPPPAPARLSPVIPITGRCCGG